MALIFAFILAFLLVGTAPVWPHSASWGYYPSGGFGLLLTFLLVYLILQGAISISFILAALLVALLVGAAPIWPHSLTWGYYPSSGAGLLLVVFVIYFLIKRD